MSSVKLLPPLDAPPNTVGIPVKGEFYDADDARRLVAQGIARRAATTPKKRKAPAPPATEG